MLHRLQIGLPAVAQESDPPMTMAQIDAIERGLIDACKEVGIGLLKRGKLQEGWMYMRPVGDKQAVRDAMADLEITSENLDEFLAIFVQEGVDIGRGVELTLEHRGTCNTITMLESVVAMRDRNDQQAGVGKLVRHVHQELLTSLRQDLSRREDGCPDSPTLEGLLAERPGLLRDGSYHIDTTHLAATVRFARVTRR